MYDFRFPLHNAKSFLTKETLLFFWKRKINDLAHNLSLVDTFYSFKLYTSITVSGWFTTSLTQPEEEHWLRSRATQLIIKKNVEIEVEIS